MSIWVHVKAEVGEGAAVAWSWGGRALASIALASLAVAALAAGQAPADRLAVFGGVLAAGMSQAITLSAVAAGVALGGRLAGWGMVAPLVLVPVGILVASWLGSHIIGQCIDQLARATAEGVGDGSLVHRLLGPRLLAPSVVFFFAPFWLLFCFSSFALLGATLQLYVWSMWIVCGGALGGLVASVPILLATTVSRLVSRARWRASIPGHAMAR